MLDVLLKPFPREPIPHWLARHAALFRFSSTGHLIDSITGSRHRGFAADLPCRLQVLADHLTVPWLTPDYFINHHTLLPYYSWFLSESRLTRIRQDLVGRNGGGIHMRLGLMASNIPLPSYYRFCPQCIENDRLQYRECYWHLEHLLPSVLVCPQHGVALAQASIHLHQLSRKYALITAEEVLAKETVAAPVYEEALIRNLQQLANDSFWLLTGHRIPIVKPSSLRKRYVGLMIDQGWATHSGRVRVDGLIPAFLAHFPAGYLELLNCPLKPAGDNWLLRLLRESKASLHPLYHLLLMQFLGITAEAIFSNSELEPLPFGKGLWPCLNTLCERYRQAVISDCQISFSSDSGRPVGVFRCPVCGFAYQRVGPDKSEEDKSQRHRIVAFGPQWENLLQQEWLNPDVSLRQLARMLGVDPRTVSRQALRLQLPPTRPNSVSRADDEATETSLVQTLNVPSKLQEQRSLWLQAADSHPELNKTELRRLFSALYARLYDNDKVWLQQNSPKAKPVKYVVSRQVDWSLRDLIIANACLRATLKILNTPKRHVQLTRTGIARKGGHLAIIEQHSQKLPLTAGLLGRLAESREEYAIRRVWETVFKWREEGRDTSQQWQLIRQSGTDRLKDEAVIREAIHDSLSWLTGESLVLESNPDRQNSLIRILKLLRLSMEGELVSRSK